MLLLTNERFTVPEALFHPSDIGIRQSGIGECAGACLQSFAPGIRELLARNIVLSGGTSCLPNFKARVEYPCERTGGVLNVQAGNRAVYRGGERVPRVPDERVSEGEGVNAQPDRRHVEGRSDAGERAVRERGDQSRDVRGAGPLPPAPPRLSTRRVMMCLREQRQTIQNYKCSFRVECL